MTLIEALLLLPEHGAPKVANRELSAALAGSSPRIVTRLGRLCSLTEGGRRFLAQFRHGRPATVSHVVVRLMIENDTLVFYLLCDESVLKVQRADLRRRLEEIQTANPGVKVMFDFRPSGDVS